MAAVESLTTKHPEEKLIPKVSIGMPVYNGEPFIRKALDSLLVQTFTDFELIISDNASTDRTEAMCREYALRDPRIRYVRQSENHGVFFNFQFVLDEARGEYFMWAAADDMWDRKWIECLVKNLGPGVAISFGHIVTVNENGNVLRRYPYFEFGGSKLLRLSRYYLAEDYYGKANIIYGLYRRRELAAQGFRMYGGCREGQDMVNVFKMLQHGKIAFDRAVMLHKYRKRQLPVPSDNHSLAYYANRICRIDKIKYIWSYFYASDSLDVKLLVLTLCALKYAKVFMRNGFVSLSRLVRCWR